MRTRDVPSPGKRRALLASAATGAESAALQDEARQVAQRLLELDASDPAKHEALSYYKVWGGIDRRRIGSIDACWIYIGSIGVCHCMLGLCVRGRMCITVQLKGKIFRFMFV